MFQLYKKRNFSAIINDTFTFLKAKGKNYFGNYIIVNGGLLLILMLLIYLMGNVFFETLFSSFGSPSSNVMIEEYFNDNLGYFIGVSILCAVLILIITLINYSFPVVYLQLLESSNEPTATEVFTAIKAKIGKVLLFTLLFLVTFFPIAIILMLLSVLLIVIIIGIPVAFIVFAAFSCWVALSFYDYMNNNSGYFTAMRNGFSMLFQNFWAHAGATALFFIIMYVIQGVLSFIPYIFGMFSLFGSGVENTNDPEKLSFAGILVLVALMVSIVLSYILSNIMLIGQGLIYYSSREENEHRSMQSDIDLIGSDSE
jgi:hypothetical protein